MLGETWAKARGLQRSVPKDRQTCASFPNRMTLIKQDRGIASLPDKPNGVVQWLPKRF